MAAGHKTLVPELIKELESMGARDMIVIVGGGKKKKKKSKSKINQKKIKNSDPSRRLSIPL